MGNAVQLRIKCFEGRIVHQRRIKPSRHLCTAVSAGVASFCAGDGEITASFCGHQRRERVAFKRRFVAAAWQQGRVKRHPPEAVFEEIAPIAEIDLTRRANRDYRGGSIRTLASQPSTLPSLTVEPFTRRDTFRALRSGGFLGVGLGVSVSRHTRESLCHQWLRRLFDGRRLHQFSSE